MTIYKFKINHLIIIYIIIYTILNWISNSYILTDNYYYTSLSSQLNYDRINQILLITKKLQWIGYVFYPVLQLIKWFAISGVIYAGLFMFNVIIDYNNCLKIILIAELPMIFATLIKLIFLIINKPSSIQDVQFFFPLSMVQLVEPNFIPSYLVYPIQQINLFEFLYWILIANGIKSFSKIKFIESFKITFFSYGLTFSLWILIMIFIQLQLS